MREERHCGADLGLSDDEVAFYDALAANGSVGRDVEPEVWVDHGGRYTVKVYGMRMGGPWSRNWWKFLT